MMIQVFRSPANSAAIALWRAMPLLLFIGIPAAVQAQGTAIPPAPVTSGSDGGGLAPPQPAGIQGQIIRFLRVIGSGVVRAKPGEAHIVFLVSTTGPSAVGALQDNAKLVAKVVAELRDRGVPPANTIWSENALVNLARTAPAPAANGGAEGGGDESPPMVGFPQYTANARVQVVTYSVSHASDIVQIGMNGGATSILEMSFEPRDLEQQKQEALIAALKDAASKASIMAAGVKVRVLYAISVSELAAAVPQTPGLDVAPPVDIAVPINIEVVYAVG